MPAGGPPSQNRKMGDKHENPPTTGGITRRSTFTTIFDRFDESRWLPWALACICAIISGLTVAPKWHNSTYAAHDSLLGTPAEGDIKAQRDVSVVDEGMTATHRAQAVADVARVYDLDLGLGSLATLRLRSAMAAARKAWSEAQATEENAQEQAAHEALGRALRLDISSELSDVLAGSEYGKPTEDLLSRALADLMMRPLVASRGALEEDRERGLVIQHVPDSGNRPLTRSITDILEVGESELILRNDLSQSVPSLPQEQRVLFARFLAGLTEANLTPNRAETELSREAAEMDVKAVTISIKKC